MLENKVIITNESNKNKIYEKFKNNWIIELDGSKINSWDDFYKIIQKEIDILKSKFSLGKGCKIIRLRKLNNNFIEVSI